MCSENISEKSKPGQLLVQPALCQGARVQGRALGLRATPAPRHQPAGRGPSSGRSWSGSHPPSPPARNWRLLGHWVSVVCP